MEKSNRIQWLDALRGLAITLVILFHFTVRFGRKYGADWIHSGPLFEVKFGWVGVYLFFMISGFIIYLTIQKKNGLTDFLIARLSRLMPPYWTAILLILLLEPLHAELYHLANRNQVTESVLNMLMIPDLFKVRYLDGAFWSLFVEVKFYILFGLLWKWVNLKNHRNYFLSFLVLISLSLFESLTHRIPFGENFSYFLFFWLGIAACKVSTERLSYGSYAILTGITALCSLGFYRDGAELVIAIPLFSFLFVGAERFFFRQPLRAVALLSPLIFLGRISYSYYLIHQPVGYLLLGALGILSLNYNAAAVLAFLFCTGAAWAGFRFIEQLDKPISGYLKSKLLAPAYSDR